MVSRRQLKRLKEGLKQGAVVVETRDGRTEVFSERAPLGLFSLQMDEVLAHKEVAPEEPTDARYEEALRLRQALEDATPESKNAYEEQCHEFFHIIKVLRRSREEMVS
jgi:acyl-CoA thioesterase